MAITVVGAAGAILGVVVGLLAAHRGGTNSREHAELSTNIQALDARLWVLHDETGVDFGNLSMQVRALCDEMRVDFEALSKQLSERSPDDRNSDR